VAADSTISIEIELQRALRQLDQLQKAFDKQNELINQASRAASRFERVIRTAMTSATKAVKGALNVFLNLRTAVVGITSAFAAREFVNFGANYERQISKLNALTRATETEQLRLRKTIREVGSTTAFTATQAAEAANVLAALGRTSTQISKELGVVVKVAGATGTAIETVSEAVAAQMNVFKESAEQVGNIFAAAYSTSAANVEKLQTALGQIGPVAKTAGLDLTQTAGAIAFLVDRGLRAEAAGTALRGVLLRLIDPPKIVQKEFEALGFTFTDIQEIAFEDKLQKIADGLENVAGQGEKNRILAAIFGDEALGAATNFISELQKGNRVIETQAEKLRQATDAAGLYGQITNDLRGAIDNLIAAVEDKLLTAFQTLEPLIKNIVKDLTDSVNALTTEEIIQSVANIGRALLTIAEEFYNAVRLAINSLSQFINSAQFQEVIALAARALSSLGFTSVEEDLARQKLVFDQALAEYRAARYELEQAQASMGAGPNQTDDQRHRMQLMLASQQLQVDALQEVMVEEHRRYLLMESQAVKAKELYDLIGDQSDFFAASNQKLDEGEQKLLAQVAAMRALKDAAEEVPTPPTPSAGTPAAPTTPIDQQLIQQQNAYALAQASMRVLLDLGEQEKAQKQEISDLLIGINKRGVERTKTEQIIADYEAEIAAVMLNENYTLTDKNKIVEALTDAKERELEASKQKLTIEQLITDELVQQLGFNSEIAKTAVSGYFSAGPNAGRAAQIGTAYTTAGGGAMGLANAAVAAVMSNEKVASAIEEQFAILFDTLDPLLNVLADLQSAINGLIKALLEGAGNIIENFADVFELGPNGYFGSGEFTRQIESIFSPSSSSYKPTATDKAIAKASSDLFEVTEDEDTDTIEKVQPKIDELLSIVNNSDLASVIIAYKKILEQSIANIEATKEDVVVTVTTGTGVSYDMTYEEFQDYQGPIKYRDLIQEKFDEEFARIDGEIAKLEEKAATVIASVISAVVEGSIGSLNDLASSADSQIQSILDSRKTEQERIDDSLQASLSEIKSQRDLLQFVEDPEERLALRTALNQAEDRVLTLYGLQLQELERVNAQREREAKLLQVQNVQNDLQTLLDNFESTIDEINDLVISLFDQVQDLLFSDNNLMGPRDAFAIAQETYESLLDGAFDENATEEDIKKLQSFVDEYLSAARDVFQSSSAYATIFEGVLSDLTLLGLQYGFNAPVQATSQLKTDAEELLEVLGDDFVDVVDELKTSIDEAALAFANQQLKFTTTILDVPIVLDEDNIRVDTSRINEVVDLYNTNIQFDTENVSETFVLNADNFNVDVSKLNLTAGLSTNMFTVNTSDLNFGTITPKAIAGTPNLGTVTPTVTAGTPNLGTVTPTVTAGTPNLGTITPRATAGIPNLGTITPSITLGTEKIDSAFDGLQKAISSAITATSSKIENLADTLYSLESALGMLPTPIETINAARQGKVITATASQAGGRILDLDGGGTEYDEMVVFTLAYQGEQSLADMAATYADKGILDNRYAVYQTIVFPSMPTWNGSKWVYEDYKETMLQTFASKDDAQTYYDAFANDPYNQGTIQKFGFRDGGIVPRGLDPMDTIPAMLTAGEYILSPETVKRYGVGSLNRLNAGDASAISGTSDPDVKRLLAELIMAVKESETDVHVYTDMRGEAKAAIGEFRTELKERTRRQGDKYIPARYI
jgi:TP901 family phage tail tape measure protein